MASGKDIVKLMMQMQFEESFGTIREYKEFRESADAEALRKAMKGLGTNEKTIIEITAKRTRRQRMQIREKYKQEYGRDLMKDFISELSGDFRQLVLALYTPLPVLDARCLHDAMKGIGTKESVLIEILATRTNDQIRAIKEVYKAEYKSDLEKDICGDTSGDFKKLLVSLSSASRSESIAIDEGRAKEDAKALYKAGEKKTGTDEETFNRILCCRSYRQLRATFREYYQIAGRDIVESIKREFSGDIEAGLIAVVQSARCTPAFFAKELYHSMKGLGTKESTLTRIVATRAEIDMAQIKEAFKAMYKKSLEKFIEGDTSGDYGKLLKAIVD